MKGFYKAFPPLTQKILRVGKETQVGTNFVQITALVALTKKSAREENLRPFTRSQMTDPTQCSGKSVGLDTRQTWISVRVQPSLAWDLEHGAYPLPSLFCPLCSEVNNAPTWA